MRENKNRKQEQKKATFSVPAFCCLFLLFSFFSYAQSPPQPDKKKIHLVKANVLKSASTIANGAERLVGDVEFEHENVLMFCDSAYLYKDNSLDAFGHVHIIQNDTIHLYGDLLNYKGDTKKAVLTHNVLVNKGDMQLTTDQLNYDVATSIGSYLTPARIVNRDNVLTSDQGYFFGKSNELTFKKNVVLTNPQFVINCDTMRYNTNSKVTYFIGPTTIKSKDNLIYCEDGWYDTQHDLSRFSKNAYILTQEQKMLGDSLYYDRNEGIGRAVRHVQIIDTTQKLTISGDFAIHYEFRDLSVITGHTLLTQQYEKDTLFLHADTLKAQGDAPKQRPVKSRKTGLAEPVKAAPADTAGTDHQKLYAYHKVKFYKHDMQGKCDSMYYNTSDSLMHLYRDPILWSGANQLTSDSIRLRTGSKSLKYIELLGTGFIVSAEDSLRYNQIRGKYMKGFFADNRLVRVNVEGNGQTIYFAREKQEVKAVNRADCSDLHIFLKDNEIDHIVFLTKPAASLYPLDKVETKELKLKDFSWRITERPLTFNDIFTW